METTHERHPEILVIGAGPGGSAAATALAQLGHDVLVVDRADFPREKICGDGITPLGVETLGRLGALEAVVAARPVVIERVRIAGPLGVTYECRLEEVQPDKPRAFVLPRVTLDEILRRHAVASGARWAGGVRVSRMHRGGDGRVTAVETGGPRELGLLEPAHVVIAVGAATALLRRSGFLRGRPDHIMTVRTYFEDADCEPDCYDFFFDRDLLPGYGWVFPEPEGRANVGVGVPSSMLSTDRPVRALFDEFVERQRTRGALRAARRAAPLKGYPLRHDYPPERAAGRNWVLVGEAAGLANPVTGEGIDLALESGLLAAKHMHASISEGRDAHDEYARALEARYGEMFRGLRMLRDALVTPASADNVLMALGKHQVLARTLVGVVQGLESPMAALEPSTMAQLVSPSAPPSTLDPPAGRKEGGSL